MSVRQKFCLHTKKKKNSEESAKSCSVLNLANKNKTKSRKGYKNARKDIGLREERERLKLFTGYKKNDKLYTP